jgi:hypothetical protein
MTDVATITIAGNPFTIPDRYEEGHELSAGEASALNQTLRENVRNNLSKKEGLTQEAVNEYAASYQFGIRAAGAGRTADPVMAEALRMARAQIKEKLKTSGKKPSDYSAEAINTAAKNALQHPQFGPPIMELARKRVAEAQSIASAELGDIINSIPEKQPEAATAPANPAAAA